MRILLHTFAFWPGVGGVPTFCLNLARALTDLGHEVTVLAPAADDPAHQDAGLGFAVVRYPPFQWTESTSYWRGLWFPRARFRHDRVQVDHVPPGPWGFVISLGSGFVVRLKRRRPRQVVLFRTATVLWGIRREAYPGADRLLSLWGFSQRFRYRQALRIERRGARAADAVLPQTELVGRVLRERYGLSSAKVRVVPNGVDLERFRPQGPRDDIRRRLGLPVDAFIVACAARLRPEKNIPYLLEALARPAAQSVHGLIVGGGTEEARLQDLARRLDLTERVTFTGERRNVEDYLAASDFFVLPSTSEAFGNSLVEAMASGLPCAALRPDFGRINTGVAEHVEDGVTGFLLDADDPGDLADRMATLTRDPERARRMGLAARRAAEAKYDWRKTASTIVAIAEGVIASRNAEG